MGSPSGRGPRMNRPGALEIDCTTHRAQHTVLRKPGVIVSCSRTACDLERIGTDKSVDGGCRLMSAGLGAR